MSGGRAVDSISPKRQKNTEDTGSHRQVKHTDQTPDDQQEGTGSLRTRMQTKNTNRKRRSWESIIRRRRVEIKCTVSTKLEIRRGNFCIMILCLTVSCMLAEKEAGVFAYRRGIKVTNKFLCFCFFLGHLHFKNFILPERSRDSLFLRMVHKEEKKIEHQGREIWGATKERRREKRKEWGPERGIVTER